LRVRTGHDFSNYKRPTLLRRIERRISIRNLPNLSAYAEYIRETPEETLALLKDLLISVTNFFRDKESFEFLEKDVFPKLLAGKDQTAALRIWVVGCATGEEAYSMAMLCAEHTIDIVNTPKIQIFATDIDETAIARSREGLYTINDAADVSPERLRRFFTKEGEEYRVRRELREMILFSAHNVIKDPPFSHIDLISCRNMLIYLNQTAQERVMEIFHFSLNPTRFLFLGNSESADNTYDLFATLSREHHIYQSRAAAIRSYPIPETIPSFKTHHPQSLDKLMENSKPLAERISYGNLHQQLLEKYAPPSVIVNENYDILHLSETAGRFLQIGGGEPTRNLIKLIKPELRLELRTALYQAVQRQTNVEASGVKILTENKEDIINILVRPVLRESNDTARGFLLILFEPATKTNTNEERVLTMSEPVLQQLEEELTYVKVQLRTTSEQFELQTEEMKASNEELQALNEELRSAAEELETSKEELQSINEELTTVNQELKVKIEEITLASNNLQNFINSTEIGTIFLDRSLRVNLFTPAARQIFNLIPTDYGRPLTDITGKLENANITEDAETVLKSLRTVEKEVRITNSQVYLMRITPYRTNDDRINGVVVSFVDITERKEAEERLYQSDKKYSLQLEEKVEERTIQLKKSRDLLQATMDSSLDMIQVFETARDESGEIVDFKWILNNHTSEKIYGNIIGKSLLQLNPGVVEEGIFDTFKKVVETGISNQSERHYVHEQFDGWFYQSVVKMGDGLAATTTNTSERKKAEQEINRLKDEIAQQATDKYLTLFNSIDEAVVWCEMITDENGKSFDCRMLELNPAFERMTGITVEAARGKTASETIPSIV
ncbi:MAG: PAS domain-containing protein, partial [Bacteroidota bacterium]|nr:PAS domain-containing protein [Bacteroidota bacterium]